jgi:y4mF family transcriptional regulator
MEHPRIATFVKYNRQRLRMTQLDLAQKSGVGLRFIRELEQGKETLRLDKINQVLELFGNIIAPVTSKQFDPYLILLDYMQKNVRIRLRNKKEISGFIVGPIYENEEISGWRVRQVSSTSGQELTPSKEEFIAHTDIVEINQGLI